MINKSAILQSEAFETRFQFVFLRGPTNRRMIIMSEKTQRTAATMRNHMHQRYDDGLHHKHDKCHLPYRLHWPSHSNNSVQWVDGLDQAIDQKEPILTISKKIQKKTRLRIVKHNIH